MNFESVRIYIYIYIYIYNVFVRLFTVICRLAVLELEQKLFYTFQLLAVSLKCRHIYDQSECYQWQNWSLCSDMVGRKQIISKPSSKCLPHWRMPSVVPIHNNIKCA
jgi:hypothetical protein